MNTYHAGLLISDFLASKALQSKNILYFGKYMQLSACLLLCKTAHTIFGTLVPRNDSEGNYTNHFLDTTFEDKNSRSAFYST